MDQTNNVAKNLLWLSKKCLYLDKKGQRWSKFIIVPLSTTSIRPSKFLLSQLHLLENMLSYTAVWQTMLHLVHC